MLGFISPWIIRIISCTAEDGCLGGGGSCGGGLGDKVEVEVEAAAVAAADEEAAESNRLYRPALATTDCDAISKASSLPRPSTEAVLPEIALQRAKKRHQGGAGEKRSLRVSATKISSLGFCLALHRVGSVIAIL